MEILGYLLIVFMGMTLGLLGGGGSILTVPILVYIFKIPPVLATAYSLFIVGVAAGIGVIKRIKQQQVHFAIGVNFALTGVVGVLISRSYIIPQLPDVIWEGAGGVLTKDILIMAVFALMMIVASFSMLRGRPEVDVIKNKKIRFWDLPLKGLAVGMLTGFVGAGGGFLIIPALVHFARLPVKIAVGTSLAIISFNSILGFLGDVWVTDGIQWPFLFTLVLLSSIGIVIGAHFSEYVSDKKLKKIFGGFILLMGVFILYKQF